jgi:pimeloyl-ACP methyl ester carboxylesterase
VGKQGRVAVLGIPRVQAVQRHDAPRVPVLITVPSWFRIGRHRVAGTLHRPRGGSRRPAVLLCHGFTGSKTESHWIFVKTARALARAGLAAYRFDFRGSGESDGEFRTMTIAREIGDARAALSHLASRAGVDPRRLGVLGLSLGGCVAANLAARDARVKSLVLWGAVAKVAPWFRSARRRYARVRRGAVVDLGGHALSPRFFTGAARVEPLRALERCRRRFPALVIHGGADLAVPAAAADRYFETLQSRGHPTARLIVKGADHTFSRLDWEAKAIRATVNWFRLTLAR